MPRPKIERVARSLRLPADLDALLAARAAKSGRSFSAEIEAAVAAWCGLVDPFVSQTGERPTQKMTAASGSPEGDSRQGERLGSDSPPCAHPKDAEVVKGWGVICQACGKRLR